MVWRSDGISIDLRIHAVGTVKILSREICLMGIYVGDRDQPGVGVGLRVVDKLSTIVIKIFRLPGIISGAKGIKRVGRGGDVPVGIHDGDDRGVDGVWRQGATE